jgi:hypothetical protein
MISLFVITLTSMLNFSVAEENSFNLMKRLDYRQEIKEKAILAVGSAMRHRNARVHKTGDEVKTQQRMKRKLK